MSATVPTADQVAAAIVAACRFTGEDPIAVASGTRRSSRARHYAMHALAIRFPRCRKRALARMVGAAGASPERFWEQSGRRLKGCGAKWWRPAVCRRIADDIPRASNHLSDFKSDRYEPPAPSAPKAPKAGKPIDVPAFLPSPRSGSLESGRVAPRAASTVVPFPPSRANRRTPFRLVEDLAMRRAPASRAPSLIAEIAGDPAPGRSALDRLTPADRERLGL